MSDKPFVTTVQILFEEYDTKVLLSENNPLLKRLQKEWISREDFEKEIKRITDIALKYINNEYDNFLKELNVRD